MNNICLLTVPGWSNIDSWVVPLEQVRAESHFQLFVVSPSPWVLSKLSKADELGERLEALNSVFIIHTSRRGNVSATNFEDARKLSRLILILEKCGLVGVPGLLSFFLTIASRFGLLFEPTVIQTELPKFKVVCSDVDVFSSNLTPRDEHFLRRLGGASFLSLWHGTAQLSPVQKNVLSHRIQDFPEVIIFSTGPSQTEKYSKYFENFDVQITEVPSPRLQDFLELREKAFRDSAKSKEQILFINRDPRTIFSRRPVLSSTVGLAALARIAVKGGVGTLLLKLHPNQSRLIAYLQLLIMRLVASPSGLNICITNKHVSSLVGTRVAFTWFSGVSVDLLAAGIPVYELRSRDGWFGPNLPRESHWNFLLNESLTSELGDKNDALDTLISSGLHNAKVISKFDENFEKHFFPLTEGCQASTTLLRVLLS